MAGAWICTVLPTFWALVATVFLIWPGLGVNWFGAGGNPNNSLAALNFSHQRLQYELSQIVPLAVIVVIGIVFYFLGGKAREEGRRADRGGRWPGQPRGGRWPGQPRGGRWPGQRHRLVAVAPATPFGFTKVIFRGA